MTAKIRNLPYGFPATHSANHENLLVSGCSFTYNNSDEHVCAWPYYLRNHANYKQVFDCSQSGAGSNHIFNSVINELETNKNILPSNTLVIVMWSGLTRTDVIATQDVTKDWHHESNYCFNNRFSTLSIFNSPIGKELDDLCKTYKLYVDTDAQIYESLIKIIALQNYLKNRGFEYVFTSFQDPIAELNRIDSELTNKALELLSDLPYLAEYSVDTNRTESCGHPTPDCYLDWTRTYLMPYLEKQKLIKPLTH